MGASAGAVQGTPSRTSSPSRYYAKMRVLSSICTKGKTDGPMAYSDEELDLVIGKIVRGWADFEDWCYGAISNLQTIVKIRHVRMPSVFPDEVYTPASHETDFFVNAGDTPIVRVKHLRNIEKKLREDDAYHAQLDMFLQTAINLYGVRNVVAHCSARRSWTDEITFHAQSTAEKALKERWKKRAEFRATPRQNDTRMVQWVKNHWEHLAGNVTFKLEDLQKAAEDIRAIRWLGDELVGQISYVGERLDPLPTPRKK